MYINVIFEIFLNQSLGTIFNILFLLKGISKKKLILIIRLHGSVQFFCKEELIKNGQLKNLKISYPSSVLNQVQMKLSFRLFIKKKFDYFS